MSSDYQVIGGPLPDFPKIQIGSWTIHYQTDLDKDNPYMNADFCITGGLNDRSKGRKIAVMIEKDIDRKDLLELIRSGKIYGRLCNADLVSRIEQNEGIILHLIENHEEYLEGPPFPEYSKD